MIIALFPNSLSENAHTLALAIREFLLERNITVVAEEGALENTPPITSVDPKEITYLLSIGGDGTILRLVHKYPNIEAPILGVNSGHLGFMADVPISDLYPSLEDLLNKKCTVDSRIMLEGTFPDKQSALALNDIVIHRGSNNNLVEIAIHVGGSYLNTFEADGIILATPNGSTAYSLAAGGPILTKSLDALVLTPISPHTISNRPIVLPANAEIQIEYLSNYKPLEVRADGFPLSPLKTKEILSIKKGKRKFHLINLPRTDYFSTLRSKLNWSGKLRS